MDREDRGPLTHNFSPLFSRTDFSSVLPICGHEATVYSQPFAALARCISVALKSMRGDLAMLRLGPVKPAEFSPRRVSASSVRDGSEFEPTGVAFSSPRHVLSERLRSRVFRSPAACLPTIGSSEARKLPSCFASEGASGPRFRLASVLCASIKRLRATRVARSVRQRAVRYLPAQSNGRAAGCPKRWS